MQININKEQADALYSIYTDIMGFVENSRDYQDVSKPEEDAGHIRGLLDQLKIEYNLDYQSGK